MRHKFIFLLIALYAMPCRADDAWYNGVGIGVGVSATSGLNIVIGYHKSESESYWLSHLGLRADFASTDPLKSAIDSAIDWYMRDGRDVGDGVSLDNGTLDAWHSGLLLDYYPLANWWRVTGGYAWGGMTLDSAIFGTVSNAPSDRFYFYLAGDHYYYNGNDFSGHASIDWNYHGPYFGTGVDLGLGCGFTLYADFGVVVAASPSELALDIPQNQLYIYNDQTNSWSPVSIPKLDADIAYARGKANQELSKIRVYPVIKLGFLYRF